MLAQKLPEAMNETYLSRKITPSMHAPKSTMQERSAAWVKDVAGSTRWPQVGLDQPPACPPHLGSWPPLDGIPWVSRDGPGPWHDHCWDEAGTLAGWEGVNLERNGPTGTAMPGTPTQQKRGVGTHVAACDSCITELCAQNVWFLDKAMLFNQPRLEIGRLSQGEASPAPLRSGVSSGPPEAPGWGGGHLEEQRVRTKAETGAAATPPPNRAPKDTDERRGHEGQDCPGGDGLLRVPEVPRPV